MFFWVSMFFRFLILLGRRMRKNNQSDYLLGVRLGLRYIRKNYYCLLWWWMHILCLLGCCIIWLIVVVRGIIQKYLLSFKLVMRIKSKLSLDFILRYKWCFIYYLIAAGTTLIFAYLMNKKIIKAVMMKSINVDITLP